MKNNPDSVDTPTSDAPTFYDPAQDLSRLLTKIGILTMRLEEAAAQLDVLQNALPEKDAEIARLKALLETS